MTPQTFFVVKGVLGVIAVSGLLWHMLKVWNRLDDRGGVGQRMRYITLFYFAVFITSVSTYQVGSDVTVVNARSHAAFFGAALLAVVAIVSIREFKEKRSKHDL